MIWKVFYIIAFCSLWILACADLQTEDTPIIVSGDTTAAEDTDTVDTEVLDTEVLDTETTDTETTDTETVDTETVDTETADTETADTETADTETADTETADTETVDTETVDTETADTETADTETVDTETVDTETVDTETADTETVDTETVDTETVDTETVDTETVDTETVDTETVDTETVDTETVDTETVDTETVDTETVDTETADTETGPGCGDDNLDDDEECDDGNTDSGDGCSSVCSIEYCGDGLVNPSGVSAHVEDFESGVMPDSIWSQGSAYGWELSAEYVHNGAYSMHPTNRGISPSTARVSIEAYTDGTVCFWLYGRSSDNWFWADYDYLYFYVGDVQVQSWLGIHTTWSEFCATVSPGWHEFSWEYKKDSSDSSVIDNYYLDEIRFANAYTEQCDDGNNTSGDGCSSTCQIE